MTFRRPLLASLLAVAAFSIAAAGLSQSYGLGEQVLTVSSAAFRPVANGTIASYNAGYISGTGLYVAPLELPDGAEILQVCVYVNDPDEFSLAVAAINRVLLPKSGQLSGENEVAGSNVSADFDTGYDVVCGAPFSYVFHQFDDVIGQDQFHQVRVTLNSSAGLGSVQVHWRRQVSPAPPVATFNDVSVIDPGYKYIEALVASGITTGCGGGNYCPDAALTRRQMAVFLSKALGLHWPD
jgi:S-layer homology domain